MEKTIEIHSESIHDETVVFEHVSSGIGPEDETVVSAIAVCDNDQTDTIPTRE